MVKINEKENKQIVEEIQRLFKERNHEKFIENLKNMDENKELFNYLEKLAKKGDPQAQFALGYCYEIGKGVEKNIQKAILWYRKVAEQGNNQAEERLKILEEK